ncbi:cellulase family glycosylhydrolase [Niallia sp. MER TA 168]|uniref:cellulase family glycosylhydrolase n=1 Tax=Niallia sp. MER TA 168 TaxID=2939568 RepID=UPI00203C5CC8|nr:cellulase family glycosylhydrolase [Niallia sp. MER TA 168]MCM3363555.1 cellulase family glycosylhydrolase [Niallia sp. MER TA 168]
MRRKLKLYVLVIILIIIALILALFYDKKVSDNYIGLQKRVPYNIGVQTHLVNGLIDVEEIRDNGFTIVREDILWSRVETEPNKYNFNSTGYDKYNQQLINAGIRPYYILGFSNKLYENNQSVITNYGLQAYMKFVDHVTSRYKNQNNIWEIWNEPNNPNFWAPAFTSVEKYTQLVKMSAEIIKKNDKTGIVVAPALSGLDETSLLWLEEAFKKGLLKYIDAISVHPYRGTPPETVITDYDNLRKLIARYSKRNINIISGEWGYSTAPAFYGKELSQLQQCQYLVRMFLINMYQNIPLSIWYDWKNDGENKDDGEQNFGIREFNSTVTKKAAVGAKTLSTTLTGYQFFKRIDIGNKNDYFLEFHNKNGEEIYVYWSQDNDHQFILPEKIVGNGTMISMLGESTDGYFEKNQLLTISSSPVYLKIKRDIKKS